MRTTSAGLLAHLAQSTTSIARCWKCVREDSVVFGFTSADIDIAFGGVVYKASTGFTPAAIEGKIDLSVTNTEVSGFLDSSSITEHDLLGGKWDNCNIEIFEVNYEDLSQGRMILGVGKTGNVKAGILTFSVELRGLAQTIQQPVGGYYTKTCAVAFGSTQCGFNVEALRVAGTVTTVQNRAIFASAATGSAADYFGAGVLTWVTGQNAGLKMEVGAYNPGAFTLSGAMPFNITIGDTFTVVPGCRKRRSEDCLGRWNNVVNFRGFPDVPLNDKVLGNASLPGGVV